METTQ